MTLTTLLRARIDAFRKRRHLDVIRRVAGYVPPSVCELELAHLKQIAVIATRLQTGATDLLPAMKAGAAAQRTDWVLRVVLPELEGDPASAQDLASLTGDAFRDATNALITRRAKAVLAHAANQLKTAVPAGCTLSEDAAVKAVVNLLRQGTTQIEAQLVAQVRDHPAIYIARYDEWISQRAQEIYESRRRELEDFIPPGLGINKGVSLNFLTQKMRGQLSFDQVGNWLLAEFKINPATYISGYGEWAEKQAAGAFAALRSDLEAAVPQGSTLNRDACLQVLKDLLNAHRLQPDLKNAFPEVFHKAKFRFVTVDPHGIIAQRANRLFDECMAHWPGSTDWRPRRGPCVPAISVLLIQGVDPTTLTETVLSNWMLSVDPPPLKDAEIWGNRISSDNPYKSAPAGARMAK